MAKHFFDRTSGAYLGWASDESMTAAAYGYDADEVIASPLPDGTLPEAVSLVGGVVTVDAALDDAAKENDKIGGGVMVLLSASLRVLIRIADGAAALTANEQNFITWLKNNLVPVLPQPTADALRALKADLERRAGAE